MINPFKKTYQIEEIKLFQFLKKSKLFEKLSDVELYHVLPLLHLRDYKKNEVVFFRGDPSQAIYLIKRGKVSINIEMEGELQVVGAAKETDCIGLNGLLGDTKRLFTTIVSSELAEIYVIPQMTLFYLFDEHLNIKSKMMESLSKLYNEQQLRLLKSYANDRGFFNLSSAFAGQEY